jgi:hypothetical protein
MLRPIHVATSRTACTHNVGIRQAITATDTHGQARWSFWIAEETNMSEARMLQIFVKRDTTFKQALDAFVDQYCSEIDASADKLIKGLMMKAEEIRKANPQ